MGRYEYLLEENEKFLKVFKAHLMKRGLSERAIRVHISSVAFFLNEYLAENRKPFDKADRHAVGDFLEWCIDKWLFNTASGVVSAMASIGLFYEYLEKKGILKRNKGVIEACREKEYYVKRFNEHEQLLEGY